MSECETTKDSTPSVIIRRMTTLELAKAQQEEMLALIKRYKKMSWWEGIVFYVFLATCAIGLHFQKIQQPDQFTLAVIGAVIVGCMIDLRKKTEMMHLAAKHTAAYRLVEAEEKATKC